MSLLRPGVIKHCYTKLNSKLIASTLHVFRLARFKASLLKLFNAEHTQSLDVDKVRDFVNSENPNEEFDDDEIYAAIKEMQEANQLMLSDNFVFLI